VLIVCVALDTQPEGNHSIVNGTKRFQTNAAAADLLMTYVKTSNDALDRKNTDISLA
jgi:alkylation response protein AidB-like acyl-CoA dehydrogenase